MTHQAKMLSHLNFINLPPPEKRIFQRQWLETNIANDILYSYKLPDCLPNDGRITWLIGTELNHVPDTMMRLSIYAAFHQKPQQLHYIDFANNFRGRSVYRYEKIIEKYSDPKDPAYRAVRAGQKLLEENLAAWKKFSAQWEKIADKVSYFKKPNHKIKQDNLLMICLNPRLGVLHELDQKTYGTNRTIIADMDCNSLFDLASRKHFGLNQSNKSVQSLRGLLCKTDRIVEQRVIHMNSYNRHVALVRDVAFGKQILDAANDVSVGLKHVMTLAFKELPSWRDIALTVGSSAKFTDQQLDELLNKADKLDAHSAKNALYKPEETHSLAERSEYIMAVISYFSTEGKQEVLELYNHMYGDILDGEGEQEYVARCAKKDFEENFMSLNFGFSEFAIMNSGAEEASVQGLGM